MANTPVNISKITPAVPDAWQSFRTEMDRLLDRFSLGFGLAPLGRLFDMAPFRLDTAPGMPSPAVDVTETDAAFTVTAELPGMSEKDIEVALTDGILTIKGEKTAEKEDKEKNYYLSERSFGAFRRSFSLPDNVDAGKIEAAFAKGVLTITLPKTAAAKAEAKKIEVKAAA